MRRHVRTRTMFSILAATAAMVLVSTAARAADFQVTGRFLYEDRIYGPGGYTGTIQDLPIRHADVELIRVSNGQVYGTGSTDGAGNYDFTVSGLTGTQDVYVRCRSASDIHPDYHITVATNTGAAVVHAITTTPVSHNTNQDLDAGSFVIQDLSGAGVAQVFNIYDNAVDAFDYLSTSQGIGRFPTAGEFVIYGWNGTAGSSGSYYTGQTINIASTASDTDGWSDTVILHESGHWASDMFGADHNPGGQHFIGDSFQDPRLSYGEGYATFFCAQVREFRAARLNDLAQPVDAGVSLYADLGIPPVPPTPGALEFAYDFETGFFSTGSPIGQIGTANETNVTSVMWDLVDGTGTPDASPGVDDEPGDETGSFSWDVIQNYMPTQTPPHWITVEDFYTGWFVRHGAGFMQTEIDSAFIGLGGMAFYPDSFEPDNDLGTATVASLATYTAAGSGLVINEVDVGAEDRVEIYNATGSPVDMTGWRVLGYQGVGSLVYTIPGFTLHPGCFVVIHENGSAAANDYAHLYTGANWVWANGGDGAVTLENALFAPQDFVRWGGSSQAVPPGTGFSGSVGSPPAGKTLGRDQNGTDTNSASNFSFIDPSMGHPNFGTVDSHTIFPAGDADLVRIDASAGDLLVVWSEGSHSAGEPQVELLDGEGNLIGTASGSHNIATLAEFQFLSSADTSYYARVTHVGPYTELAPLKIEAYKRPVAQIAGPPVGLIGDADNTSDVGDMVTLNWLNGGAYDSVRVSRDGSPLAVLPGGPSSFNDTADRGTYTYSVLGYFGGAASDSVSAPVFAGLIDCYFSDGLESGTADYALDLPWNRVSTLSQSGSWSLHDSPSGNYANDRNISAAMLVPGELVAYPTLEFDHICITEATYDYGIVEISANYGANWTELARYDLDDHPQWSDQVANPGDWVHESLSLADYVGKKIRVRFRLETDGFVTNDGWYLDNIAVSSSACQSVTGIEDGNLRPAALLTLAGGNPFRGGLGMALRAAPGSEARVQVFDPQGRLVRTVFDGRMASEEMFLTWDGKDGAGRTTAAGFYLLRAVSGEDRTVKKVVKLP